MRTFHCDHCHSPVYFENTRCTHCGHELGVLPAFLQVSALRPVGGDRWQSLMPAALGSAFRKCENYRVHEVCNWMVPEGSVDRFCIACRLNAVIPNLSRPGFVDHWYRLERSKRRLIYSLIRLGLPLHSKQEDPTSGLAFSFVSSLDTRGGERVVTGHANGHITINIDEADPSLRERNRLDLREKYRTLQGHFRHEIGHYYWDVLIRDSDAIDRFRNMFGDERDDYAVALDRYYNEGPPTDWPSRFITRYASSHPWEDWAETWAHYLHIVDTLETAENFGLQVEQALPDGSFRRASPDFDPYHIVDFQPIVKHWVPLTFALNSLNRSMGLRDLYPFTLSQAAVEKLRFVHEVVRAQQDLAPARVDVTGPNWKGFVTRIVRRLRGFFR